MQSPFRNIILCSTAGMKQRPEYNHIIDISCVCKSHSVRSRPALAHECATFAGNAGVDVTIFDTLICSHLLIKVR
jgi:hypothetical protein